MGAMKRMEVDKLELMRIRYRKMDALQIEEVCHAAATAAGKQLQLRGLVPAMNSWSTYAELYTFIEGQLERLLGE